MKKKLLLILTMLCTSVLGFSQTFSLKDCVEKAIKNHPDYQAVVLDGEMANANLNQAKSQRLPQMGISINQSTNTGRSIDRFTNSYINQLYSSTFAQASLSQPIFQGFQIKENIAANELRVQSGLQLTEAMKNNLTIRIIQAYLTYLQAEELAQLAELQAQASEEQYQQTQKRVDAGILASRDVLQIKTQLANDEFSAITQKGQARQARLALFQLLNISPDPSIEFSKVDLPNMLSFTADGVQSVTFDYLPEIKAADLQINSFDHQYKAIKAQNLPSLNFFASYNTFYASSNKEEEFFSQLNATRNSSLSLGLFIPIFGKLQTSPLMQQTLIQKRQAQNQLKNTKLMLSQAYYTALENHDIAKEQYENALNQVSINEENLYAVSAQINAGTVLSSEYILAKTNFDRANSNLIQAKYSCLLQEKILRFYREGSWDLY